MRTIFCGQKNVALTALDDILQRGWEVLCVAPRSAEPEWRERPHFAEGLKQRKLDFATQAEVLNTMAGRGGPAPVEQFLSEPVDLVISYLFPERVQTPLLQLPTIAAINMHPAPLPEYGGMSGYNDAILDQRKTYGVTAHHMDETFDTGDIILKREFSFDCDTVTAVELERMTRPCLAQTFRELVAMIDSGEPLPRIPQSETHYVNRQQFEASKILDLANETAESLERKARAFWYPPYDGAHFLIDGRKFSIVPNRELEQLARMIHSERDAPSK
jgi:methionyl-tRNA formyltransferase